MRFTNNDGEVEVKPDDYAPLSLTPSRLRDIAMRHGVTSGPGVDRSYMPTQNELGVVARSLAHAINHGQMIDFGHWPNGMIKKAAVRGGDLYSAGALSHPFGSPYVILHSWSDEMNPRMTGTETCAYLVNPFRNEKLPDDFEAMEITGLSIGGIDCVSVNDRVTFEFDHEKKSAICGVIPFAFRFPEFRDDPEFIKSWGKGVSLQESAMGNVVDPVMTALAILNTKGIVNETIRASDKLNSARRKAGKSIIPPYRKVNSSGYVTALLARQERKGEGKGGTHASPITHIRMGHLRNYKSGEVSFVRDTIVNASEEARLNFKSTRSHYIVKR